MMIFLIFFIALALLIFPVWGSSIFNCQLPKSNFKFLTQSAFGKANWFQNSWGTNTGLVNLFPKRFSTFTKEEKEPPIFNQEFWRNNRMEWGTPEWKINETGDLPGRFSMRPYRTEFSHPSEGKKVTILVFPIIDLGNPSGFNDVEPDNGMRVEIMKESLISKKIIPHILNEYSGIDWVIFEKVVAFKKDFGSYSFKGPESVVPQSQVSNAAQIAPPLTDFPENSFSEAAALINQETQKRKVWLIIEGALGIILVIICLTLFTYLFSAVVCIFILGGVLFIVYLLDILFRFFQ
jgi:hypothetical protein